jgi:hypothetical protein
MLEEKDIATGPYNRKVGRKFCKRQWQVKALKSVFEARSSEHITEQMREQAI